MKQHERRLVAAKGNLKMESGAEETGMQLNFNVEAADRVRSEIGKVSM